MFSVTTNEISPANKIHVEIISDLVFKELSYNSAFTCGCDLITSISEIRTYHAGFNDVALFNSRFYISMQLGRYTLL